MDSSTLCMAMIQYNEGDPRRIQHLIKVHEFAMWIGKQEKLDGKTQYILETAALVHDIGIRNAEKTYGKCSGKLQEQMGPPEAEKLLVALGYEPDVIERVCYLVGHHHTYTEVDGMDYRILLEADFLVNAYEDQLDIKAIRNGYERIFETNTGKEICRVMFGLL